MEKKKGRPGRPKKPVSDRLPQFSIRLSAVARLGLHMLARNRGISLSQAVEFAVQQAMSNTEVGRQTIMELTSLSLSSDGKRVADPVAQEKLAAEVLESEASIIQHMPPELRSPEERYFLTCVQTAGKRYADDLEFLRFCKHGFKIGISEVETVRQWHGIANETTK